MKRLTCFKGITGVALAVAMAFTGQFSMAANDTGKNVYASPATSVSESNSNATYGTATLKVAGSDLKAVAGYVIAEAGSQGALVQGSAMRTALGGSVGTQSQATANTSLSNAVVLRN